MKRALSIILLAALLLGVLPGAQAATSGYALVNNTNRLNIRNGPGTEYGIIGGIARGEWVEVYNIQGSWINGKALTDGTVGYFSGSFLQVAQPGSGGAGSIAVVNNPNPSSFLNLRQSPSYTAQVLAIFYNGATATVISESGGWYYVEISGMRGYFRQEFLRVSGGMSSVGTATIYSKNGGSVNLRSAPSYSSMVIGTGAPGTVVNVYLKGNKFWYIGMAGTYGFMDASFLTGGGASGGNPVPNPPVVIPSTTNAIVSKAAVSLNLREQPSTSSRVIGTYKAETAIQVQSQGSVWSRVKVPLSGKTGYMMTRFLTLYGLPVTPTKTVTHPERSYVNLRTRPSASGAVTLRVPDGSLVNIITAGGSWAQVEYRGTRGYMMTYFLK